MNPRKVAHAAAYGLQSIDMVYINFKDLEGLEVNSQQGADLGFTGKQVIHPNNIQTVQRVFSPRKAFERLCFYFQTSYFKSVSEKDSIYRGPLLRFCCSHFSICREYLIIRSNLKKYRETYLHKYGDSMCCRKS